MIMEIHVRVINGNNEGNIWIGVINMGLNKLEFDKTKAGLLNNKILFLAKIDSA